MATSRLNVKESFLEGKKYIEVYDKNRVKYWDTNGLSTFEGTVTEFEQAYPDKYVEASNLGLFE